MVKWCWRIMRLAGVLAAFVAMGLGWVIWRETPVHAVANGKPVETLDVLSLQLDILSLTIAAVGIGLGAMALYGYQALKEAAEARAEKAAMEVAEKALAKFTKDLRRRVPALVRREVTDANAEMNEERSDASSDLDDVVDLLPEEGDDAK